MSDEAQNNALSLSDAALQWILNQRGTTSVLVGVSKVEQMEKNIKAVLEA
jgi:aryl-alcohol dehydrogenase-like predicted oxidoreductase